jgi:Tfp pilus assembly protein FimT
MATQTVRGHSSDGFSLIELIMVMGVATTISVLAMVSFSMAAAIYEGDAELRTVEAVMRRAREMAINERRDMEVQFVNPNLLQIIRHNLPNGTAVVQTTALEHDTTFYKFVGMADTPDQFGNPTAVSFSRPGAVMFSADGRFTDAVGTVVNGTILIGQLNKPMSARAVTVFGATATIRTYRWNGTAWRR